MWLFQNLIGMLGRKFWGNSKSVDWVVSKPYRYARKESKAPVMVLDNVGFKTL